MASTAQPSRNPSQSSGDATGAIREVLGKFLQSSIDDMLPARIVAYDRATNRATIQPLIAVVDTDGVPMTRNQFVSIPVFNIGGGAVILSFNLVPGDLGWIKATDRDIADFLKFYKEAAPSTRRMHDFSNGLFIPDVMTGYTIDAEDEGAAVLQTLDGAVRVSIFPDKIKVTAPLVEVDSPLITSTGNATIDGTVKLGGEGGLAVARLGDTVMINGNTGTITSASGIHTAT